MITETLSSRRAAARRFQTQLFKVVLLTLYVDVKEPAAPCGGWESGFGGFPSLSKLKTVGFASAMPMVGVTGFEPVTLRLSSACSNQLSYTPRVIADFRLAISD